MRHCVPNLVLLLGLTIPLLAQAPTPTLMIEAHELTDYSVIRQRIKDLEHLPCNSNAVEYNTHTIHISDFVGAKVSVAGETITQRAAMELRATSADGSGGGG